MKCTTCTIVLDRKVAGRKSATVKGYAVEVCGIPLVVHRIHEDEKQSKNGLWGVSEPRTGLSITGTNPSARLGGAVMVAEACIRHAGVDKVRRLIEEQDRTA